MKPKLHTQINELATLAAKKFNLPLESFLLLAQNHDIGKVKISKNVLYKKSSLTPNEWEIIKLHPIIGYKIAQSIPKLKHIAKAILYHHERWDGKGYPYGLKQKEIPLEARAIAIIDAYDAMTTNRPYRKAISKQEAILELKRCAGTQFDPELVEIFIGEILKEVRP